MAAEIIPDQIFMLILVLILAVVVIIVVSQWKKVSQSNNTLKLMEKEIELKKIAMVEKDLENKRIMENPIQFNCLRNNRNSSLKSEIPLLKS